ncbi:MAG: hypothetical protein QOC84_695 [Bradyrhizobium sp.]|nr:hypothetical protein [Bradyrhizobium sp.]
MIGIGRSGGDKAPVPGMVKARTRLMPDSHNDDREIRNPLDRCLPWIRRTADLKPMWNEPFATKGYPFPGRARMGRDHSAGSGQNKIDQRDHSRQDARCDQGVVGSDAGGGLERALAGLLGHAGGLVQASPSRCEAGHSARDFSGAVARNELAGSGLVETRGFGAVQAGTRDGPAISAMAIGGRREIMAVDADRRHGTGLATGISYRPMRPVGPGASERATGAPGLYLWRLAFQPAELDFGVIGASLYSPAICSLGRRPRSIPRSFASSRAM